MKLPPILKRIARTVATAKRAWYQAAEVGRLHAPPRYAPNPNQPVLQDAPIVIARVRSQIRNNPVVAGALRNMVNMVLPSPIRVEPDIRPLGSEPGRSATLQSNQVERLYHAWSAGPCDFSGWASHRMTLHAMLKMAFRSMLSDGEVFIVFRNRLAAPGLPSLQIELIERDRLGLYSATQAGASVLIGIDAQRPGIVYDKANRPIAYEFARSSSPSGMGDMETIPAEDVIHLMMPDRPGMDVGALALAAVLIPAGNINECISSELEIKALMSRVAGIYQGDMSALSQNMMGMGGDPGSPYRQVDIQSATIWELPEGEFKQIDYNRPGAGFDDFVSTCLRFMAVGLGIPYSVLSGDYRGASWSSERAEWQKAIPNIKDWLDLLAYGAAVPIYQRFVRAATLEGMITITPAIGADSMLAHRVHLPGMQYIDPLKEIQAERLAIDSGFLSPQDVCAIHGKDYYATVDAIAEANAYAKSKGVVLNFGPQGPGKIASAVDPEPPEETEEPAGKPTKESGVKSR